MTSQSDVQALPESSRQRETRPVRIARSPGPARYLGRPLDGRRDRRNRCGARGRWALAHPARRIALLFNEWHRLRGRRRAAFATAAGGRAAGRGATPSHARLGALGSGARLLALFPRVLLPAGLALLALLAALRFPANESRRVTASVAGALALAIAVELAFAFAPHGVVHNAPSRAFVFAEKSEQPSDWSSYGRTDDGHALFAVHANQPRECRRAGARLDLSFGRRRPGHGAEHAAADRRRRLHLLA